MCAYVANSSELVEPNHSIKLYVTGIGLLEAKFLSFGFRNNSQKLNRVVGFNTVHKGVVEVVDSNKSNAVDTKKQKRLKFLFEASIRIKNQH